MSSPKVSIGIISYNHAAYLPTTIESALAQTYRDFEIVIVDDGSTDESLAIAESYAVKHRNVRVFTHPNHVNKGISATCNLVIEHSRGELINILGSDDVYYPYTIDEQVEYLNDNPAAGMVCGAVQLIDKDGNLMMETFGENIWCQPDYLKVMITANKISAPTVMVRRICYKQVGLYAEKVVHSDWEMWLNILFLSDWKIGYVDKPLAMYRVHDENVSLNKPPKVNYYRNLQALLNIERKLKEKNINALKYNLIKERIAQAVLDMFYLSAEAGEMSEAMQYLSRYLKSYPKKILQPRRVVSVFYRVLRGCSKATFPGK